MKKVIIFIILNLYLLCLLTSCGDNKSNNEKSDGGLEDMKMIPNIIVEQQEYTLYLYDVYDYSDIHRISGQKIFDGVVLTNSMIRDISPTLVMKGDTFIDWKAAEINADYIYYDDGRMYPNYSGGVTVNFEGKITVKAKIDYYKTDGDGEQIFIIPDDEYQKFFPMLYNESSEYPYITGFIADNTNEIAKLLDYKYGEYECELTVKDFTLVRVPIERFSTATITDVNVLYNIK